MGSRVFRASLTYFILLCYGQTFGFPDCLSGFFQTFVNILPTWTDLKVSTEVSGKRSSSLCITSCLTNSDCRSIIYNASSDSCYHLNTTLNVSSEEHGLTATPLSYAVLRTLRDDLNECGLPPSCSAVPLPRLLYTGCIDAKAKLNAISGPYYIDPDGLGPFMVWCDFIGNEAWTVFQRRMNGSVDFYRGWTEYKNGFGNIDGEHWLGLDRIYRLTSGWQPKLNIYLDDFDGASRMANYSSMVISNETSLYTLTLGNYTGDAGDSMGLRVISGSSGMNFTTFDRDNDWSSGNCAVVFQGAWWYRSCHQANLNGRYLRGFHSTFANGVNWNTWRGYNYSLRTSVMRIAI